jgi:Tfp pilus assembly protein FimT
MTVLKKPVQVYLDQRHLNILSQLVEKLSISRAEALRRGLESLAREVISAKEDPAWQLIGLAGEEADLPTDWSVNHDRYLVEELENE